MNSCIEVRKYKRRSMKLFGTDGIRGVVGEKITSKLAFNIGIGIGKYIIQKNLSKKVIIGKDTRISGDAILYSIASGLMEMGIDCIIVGIVPTACISFLANKLEIAFGIMITASHNSWEMNGIKIINHLGYKLSVEEENILECIILKKDYDKKIQHKGKLLFNRKLINMYLNYLFEASKINLKGLNIALDCANGANYKLAYLVFKKLNANIINISTSNDGYNINKDCGAQYIDNLKDEVLKHNCDFGFAFDGDADRLRVVLKDGKELDGDDLLYLFSRKLKELNKLNALTVVGTTMTNLGIEQCLNKLGIKLIRADVGDRNVIEKLREFHYSLGGESSGHVCFHEFNTTCDALFNALIFLKYFRCYASLNQTLVYVNKSKQIVNNISLENNISCVDDKIKELCKRANILQNDYTNTKILIRKSGTENLLRVMIDSFELENVNNAIKDVENIIKKIFV